VVAYQLAIGWLGGGLGVAFGRLGGRLEDNRKGGRRATVSGRD
jgi:hypothetical protein